MQYRECYAWGVSKLEKAQVPEAELDARLLLEFVCGTDRNALLVHGEREVSQSQFALYREKVALREKRIPLQLITGVQEFMGLEFAVNEHVLIPRQDTEVLVEQVLKVLKPGMQILDMCTGSGCILISLLWMTNGSKTLKGAENMCRGVGVDLSAHALAVARQNSRKLLGYWDEPGRMPENRSKDRPQGESCVTWLESDLFEKVTGAYDVIVSNPPYIPTEVVKNLMPEVRDYEPRMALDGKEDGLFFYKKITAQAADFLKKDGCLFFEIGHDQGSAVAELMENNNFTDVKVIQDYAGLDRVVFGRRKG